MITLFFRFQQCVKHGWNAYIHFFPRGNSNFEVNTLIVTVLAFMVLSHLSHLLWTFRVFSLVLAKIAGVKIRSDKKGSLSQDQTEFWIVLVWQYFRDGLDFWIIQNKLWRFLPPERGGMSHGRRGERNYLIFWHWLSSHNWYRNRVQGLQSCLYSSPYMQRRYWFCMMRTFLWQIQTKW